MGVITRATGVLQLSAGCVAGGGLRAHHVLILLALELTLQLDLPDRGHVHGKEPCRVNKRMRQHGVALRTMSAQQQK